LGYAGAPLSARRVTPVSLGAGRRKSCVARRSRSSVDHNDTTFGKPIVKTIGSNCMELVQTQTGRTVI
jgi:hypothetical protein